MKNMFIFAAVMEGRVLREVPPLMDQDFMYVADRHKREFDYPIHNHEVFELNFVANAAGVNRIVGDSSETIGSYDLVLITSPDLEHVWAQGDCCSEDIREITVQFFLDFTGDHNICNRTPMLSIQKMCMRARKGLAFPLDAIMRIYPMLDKLSQTKESFFAMQELLAILYELSKIEGARELATSSFAKVDVSSDSRRVLKVEDYINKHYMDEIRLSELADLIGMSPSAFSRFFKLSASKTVNEYIVDIRLGVAARKLVDTTDTVSEICYDCGFNTLSNFNRLFKKRKGCNPTEFREKYFKTKVVM
jgi:AraC-like DNA-binding protein